VTNGLATITWGSISGVTYKLQYKNTLTETNWHDVSPTTTATGATATATNVLGSAPQRFYRVAIGQLSMPDLLITSIKLTNGVAAISWDAIAGKTYRLQYKTALTNTTWLDAPPDITATGPAATVTNSVGNASRRFYRVMLLP